MTTTAPHTDLAELIGRVRTLEDRAELEDLVKRYAIGCDTRDRAVLRSTFTSDARATYASDEPLVGADAIVGWIGEMTAAALWQQHMISPYSYEIDGDRARVIAYLISHQNFDANPHVTTMMTSRYTLQCARTDDGWLIKDLVLMVGWIESRYGDQAKLP
jgi:hypothetical protein